MAIKSLAKGTGYSNYKQKGWDVGKYMAAQKEKDKQIELVLEKIYQELRKLHGAQQVVPVSNISFIILGLDALHFVLPRLA